MADGQRVIIFGFLPQNLKTMAVAVAFSMSWRDHGVEGGAGDQARGLLAAFRDELCSATVAGARADDPGWPCSLVAALEPGRRSWTLPLDAVRLSPADDATEVTAGQVREVIAQIIAAGQ